MSDPADRVLVWPEARRRRFVHHCRDHGFVGVVSGQQSSGKQRNADGLEVARADLEKINFVARVSDLVILRNRLTTMQQPFSGI